MNIKTLEQIIKNKSSKVEFAIVTNLKNGESQVFEPGKKLSGDFDKFQEEVENFFKSKKNGIIENSDIFVETYIRPIKVIIIATQVFLSGFSFKKIVPNIAESIGASAIINNVFATLVFCIEIIKVMLQIEKLIT